LTVEAMSRKRDISTNVPDGKSAPVSPSSSSQNVAVVTFIRSKRADGAKSPAFDDVTSV
jgi:hypothetical protein